MPAEILRTAALAVLTAPLLPSLAILFGVLLGDTLGCARVGSDVCAIAGFDVGEFIRDAIDAAWATPVFILAPMLVATVLAHKSSDDLAVRLTWGAVAPAIALMLVLAAPVAAVHFADHDACRITASGRGLCRVFGVDWGDRYATSAMVPWLMIPGAGIALVYGLAYCGFVAVATWLQKAPAVSRSAASSPGWSR